MKLDSEAIATTVIIVSFIYGGFVARGSDYILDSNATSIAIISGIIIWCAGYLIAKKASKTPKNWEVNEYDKI